MSSILVDRRRRVHWQPRRPPARRARRARRVLDKSLDRLSGRRARCAARRRDTADREAVNRLLAEHGIENGDALRGAYDRAGVRVEPLKYYGNNTCATRNLLECCDRAGVKHVVFSSTAAVYGIPSEGVAREESPTVPINPTGSPS